MRKLIIIIVFVSFCLSNIKCSKSTPENQAPSSVQLIYPSANLLCIDNNILFDWSDATDPESDDIEYNVLIALDRSMTNIVENRTVTASQLSVTLDKDQAFYWSVNALDVNNNQGTISETFAFFTKGDGVSNYAPFTSELLTPEDNSQVTAGSLDLTWNAADSNVGDSLTYEVYFGENSALTLQDDTLTDKSYIVTVESGKTYSWKVNVVDQNGAKSIGQVWTFNVN